MYIVVVRYFAYGYMKEMEVVKVKMAFGMKTFASFDIYKLYT